MGQDATAAQTGRQIAQAADGGGVVVDPAGLCFGTAPADLGRRAVEDHAQALFRFRRLANAPHKGSQRLSKAVQPQQAAVGLQTGARFRTGPCPYHRRRPFFGQQQKDRGRQKEIIDASHRPRIGKTPQQNTLADDQKAQRKADASAAGQASGQQGGQPEQRRTERRSAMR